tara:strand:+ start:104 stop:376 length:273 start_codon:yes stop_codon:yes gene_type:complete
MKVIIYKQDNGSVAVVYPNQTVVDKYGIDALAKKDVPTGKAYKIVDISSLPTDLTFFEAWTVDESLLTDGVGDDINMFFDDPQHPDNKGE